MQDYNSSDLASYVAWEMANDPILSSGQRRNARLLYGHRYDNAGMSFGASPRPIFSDYVNTTVQPVVGGMLKGWGAVIGWLIGFGR